MKNTFLITTLLATTALATSAWADTCTAKSGNCGTNCTYSIDTNCHLVVQGPTEEGQSGSIRDSAFSNLNGGYPITSAEIKGNITDIGSFAFSKTYLTSIAIPDGVTSIGAFAFLSATSLTSITIPDSVASISAGAFQGATSLTNITLPNNPNFTSLSNDVFNNATSLTSITIPNSVTSIVSDAFKDATSLTSITIPDSVTSIGSEAFYGATSVTSLVIPDSVTSIGARAFASTGLTSLVIPDSVTSIPRYTFENMPSNGKLYCPTGLDCYSYTGYSGRIISYTKNAETGVYTIGSKTYASAQDMQSNTTCAVDTGECAKKVAQAMAGSMHCATEQACANLLKMVSDENYDCNSIKTCSAFAKDSANNINLASLYGAPAGGNGGNSGTTSGGETQPTRRIYTVEEARQAVEAAGTDTVNVRIRYK